MQKIPFQVELERAATMATPASVPAVATLVTPAPTTTTTTDWRRGLPALIGRSVSLRELRVDDAPALLSLLTTEEVSRFISAPPTTLEGFERFIEWTLRERENGTCVCFAVVLRGSSSPIGLFQVHSLEIGFSTAEWGFALGSAYWGSGVFTDSARLVLDFAFDTLGVHRLEARAAVSNGRGNGALRKLGAVQEGVLRQAFERHGGYHDQMMWSILAEEWRFRRLDCGQKIH